LGHVITANVVSRMTSFGKCLCVRQPDGGFVNIPFNIPMRTGVKRMGPGAEGWEVCFLRGFLRKQAEHFEVS
jgi:hypothetical protein